MPNTGYTFDSADFYTRYGMVVQEVKGHQGFPKRKTPSEYSWDDEDGSQPFVTEDDISFEARDITLKCYLKASTEDQFHTRLSAIRSAISATGLHDLTVKYNPNTYRVMYTAGSVLEMLGKWTSTTNIGTFYLPFREPYPTYSAVWKGLAGRWTFASADEVVGSNLITAVSTNSTFSANTPSTNYSNWAAYNSSTLGAGTGFITAVKTSGNGGVQLATAYMTGETRKRSYKFASDLKVSATPCTVSEFIGEGTGTDDSTNFAVTTTLTSYTKYLQASTLTSVGIGIATINPAGKTITADNVYVYPVNNNDKTSANNDAQLYGPTYTTDRQTTSNGALDFDGTDDHVDTGATFQTTFKNSFSIAMWIKPDDGQPASNEYLCGVLSDSLNKLYFYNDTAGKLNVDYEANGGNVSAQTNAAVFSNGAASWSHVAIVLNNDTKQISIYFNGAKQALSSAASGDMSSIIMDSFASTYNIYLGAGNSAGTAIQYYAGGMHDTRIYKRAISAEEVKVLYHTYPDGTLDY